MFWSLVYIWMIIKVKMRIIYQVTELFRHKWWISNRFSPEEVSIQTDLKTGKKNYILIYCPVCWGGRIHPLHLYRGVNALQRVFCIRHETICWWGSSNVGDLGNVEYPFIAIAPRSTLAQSGSIWYGPIYGSTRTKLY